MPIGIGSQRVAKVSKGLIPPPFLITDQYVFELLKNKYKDGNLFKAQFFKKIARDVISSIFKVLLFIIVNPY